VAVAAAAKPKRKARRPYTGPACPQCGKALGNDPLADGERACRSCGRVFTAYRFAPVAERTAVITPLTSSDAASPCARHEGNASVAACGRCGVFMCQLCRIDSDGLVLCPGCFERLADEGALPSARRSYKDYGRLSSHTALLGFFLVWPFGIFIGPFAIWMGIKGLRARTQPGVRISKTRCVVAIVVGIIEVVLWLVIIGALVWAFERGGR
jgi:ribosomal protein L37AE/L43A